MSKGIALENEMRSLFNVVEFVAQTCDQMNKDLLGLSDLAVSLPPNHNAENVLPLIADQVKLILTNLLEKGLLQQFIYKVDMPEKEYRACLNSGNWDELSFLIIWREAQKVFLKKKFSAKD